MTTFKFAVLVAAGYLVVAAGLVWLNRRLSVVWGDGDVPGDADLHTIDEARAEFEDRMHVVGVHAHDDGTTVTRRTLRMPWLSVACSSERHGACRVDEWSCECPCHRPSSELAS